MVDRKLIRAMINESMRLIRLIQRLRASTENSTPMGETSIFCKPGWCQALSHYQIVLIFPASQV